MCGGFYGGPELLIIPFIPVISAYKLSVAAVSSVHLQNVKLQQALFPSVLVNKITTLKTKLSVMVLASNETLADLNAKIGLLYLVKGELASAESYLVRATELCAAHYLYHYYLGLFYGRINKRPDMINCFKLAVANLEYKKPQKSATKKLLHNMAGMYATCMRYKTTCLTLLCSTSNLFEFFFSTFNFFSRQKQQDSVDDFADLFVEKRDSYVKNIVTILPSISGHAHSAVQQRAQENNVFKLFFYGIKCVSKSSIANNAGVLLMGDRNYDDALQAFKLAFAYLHDEESGSKSTFSSSSSSSSSTSSINNSNSNNSSSSSSAYQQVDMYEAFYNMNIALCHYYCHDFKTAIPFFAKTIELAAMAYASVISSSASPSGEERANAAADPMHSPLTMRSLQVQALDFLCSCHRFLGNEEAYKIKSLQLQNLEPNYEPTFHYRLLPRDIMCEILSYVYRRDLKNVKLTCNELNELTLADTFSCHYTNNPNNNNRNKNNNNNITTVCCPARYQNFQYYPKLKRINLVENCYSAYELTEFILVLSNKVKSISLSIEGTVSSSFLAHLKIKSVATDEVVNNLSEIPDSNEKIEIETLDLSGIDISCITDKKFLFNWSQVKHLIIHKAANEVLKEKYNYHEKNPLIKVRVVAKPRSNWLVDKQ